MATHDDIQHGEEILEDHEDGELALGKEEVLEGFSEFIRLLRRVERVEAVAEP